MLFDVMLDICNLWFIKTLQVRRWKDDQSLDRVLSSQPSTFFISTPQLSLSKYGSQGETVGQKTN